jgi:hypothetical protein
MSSKGGIVHIADTNCFSLLAEQVRTFLGGNSVDYDTDNCDVVVDAVVVVGNCCGQVCCSIGSLLMCLPVRRF